MLMATASDLEAVRSFFSSGLSLEVELAHVLDQTRDPDASVWLWPWKRTSQRSQQRPVFNPNVYRSSVDLVVTTNILLFGELASLDSAQHLVHNSRIQQLDTAKLILESDSLSDEMLCSLFLAAAYPLRAVSCFRVTCIPKASDSQ